jgi:hypothetical protein
MGPINADIVGESVSVALLGSAQRGGGALVAAAVPQHVEVDGQRQPGALADDLDEAVEGIRGERGAALLRTCRAL